MVADPEGRCAISAATPFGARGYLAPVARPRRASGRCSAMAIGRSSGKDDGAMIGQVGFADFKRDMMPSHRGPARNGLDSLARRAWPGLCERGGGRRARLGRRGAAGPGDRRDHRRGQRALDPGRGASRPAPHRRTRSTRAIAWWCSVASRPGQAPGCALSATCLLAVDDDRRGEPRHAAGSIRMPARDHLRIGEDRIDGLIGPAGMPAASSASENSAALRRARSPAARSGISAARFVTRSGIGAETLVPASFRQAEHRAQPRELPIVADRDDDLAVGDLEGLVGHDIGVGVAHPVRHLADDQLVHRLVGEHARPACRAAPCRYARPRRRLALAQAPRGSRRST